MFQTITLTAGQRLEFHERGDFVRLMSATAPVTIDFYRAGAEIAEATSVGAGYAERFLGGEFDRLMVTSATAQTIQLVTRLGNEVLYDTPPVGNVQVTNAPSVSGAFTQEFRAVAPIAVGVSITMTLANANRRALHIQNISTVDIFLTFDGSTATTNGFKLKPDQIIQFHGYAPTGQINMLSSVAGNVLTFAQG